MRPSAFSAVGAVDVRRQKIDAGDVELDRLGRTDRQHLIVRANKGRDVADAVGRSVGGSRFLVLLAIGDLHHGKLAVEVRCMIDLAFGEGQDCLFTGTEDDCAAQSLPDGPMDRGH